jgi:hypothetical protein
MNTNILQKATEFCLAQYNNIQHNYKHFSFIFRKTRLVAFGINAPYKTHPVALRFGHRFASIHSELAAILSFPYPNKELRDCRLINVRVDKYGKIIKAEPVLMGSTTTSSILWKKAKDGLINKVLFNESAKGEEARGTIYINFTVR